MSGSCPICGVSGNQEEVCPHYIFSIWEENFGDELGAPVWGPIHVGSYHETIKDACDALFRAINESSAWLQDTEQQAPLNRLLNSLGQLFRTDWRGDFDSFPEFVSSNQPHLFNEYLGEIYRLSTKEEFHGQHVLSHSPGLDWTTIYFWSENPATTAENMVRFVNQDTIKVEGLL